MSGWQFKVTVGIVFVNYGRWLQQCIIAHVAYNASYRIIGPVGARYHSSTANNHIGRCFNISLHGYNLRQGYLQ